MNSNKRVLSFVFIAFVLLLILSFCDLFSNNKVDTIKNLNIISDLILTDNNVQIRSSIFKKGLTVKINTVDNFDLYKSASLITNFNSDTNKASLQFFAKKLKILKNGKNLKVRIAYLGDSMIEGDLITQTLRKKLQEQFGGNGVGYVPINSIVSNFRQTVQHKYSNGWIDNNFSSNKFKDQYLSGHNFISNNDWVFVKDNTVINDSLILEKSILTGYSSGVGALFFNRQKKEFLSSKKINRILLSSDKSNSFKVDIPKQSLPFFGFSFESPVGVILDNFSYRGISGIELSKFDSTFFSHLNSSNKYDLIILHYGINLLYKPNTINFDWYTKKMVATIKNIKKFMPDTEILLISTSDRAFRINGNYLSTNGVDSLVKAQAKIAYQTTSAFYNLYSTMGGKNSIIAWVNQKPALANKDYIHPNFRGAELIGNNLFQSLLRDFKKYN